MPKNKEKGIQGYLDLKTITRNEIVHLIRVWPPRGSGPLGPCKVICALLFNVAELKGFAPILLEEVQSRYDTDFYKKNPCSIRDY